VAKGPTAAAAEAAKTTGENGYMRVPVAKDGKLVGVISVADLAEI
jgi:CBS domain-containing protein